MKLNRISTRNFRLLAEVDVEIPEGVTGIIGVNESGKSTLATEALLWAFYGGKATRGTKEGLRWNRAKPRQTAGVDVEFEIGGKVYRVERTETNARLFDATTDKVLADGTAPVNKAIPQLVGMDLDEFTASYLTRQKDVTRIAAMLPTERQAFIRQVMGVGKIDSALKACRKRKSELSQELAGLEAGLGEREPLEQEVAGAKQELVEKVGDSDKAVEYVEHCRGILEKAQVRFNQSEEKRQQYETLHHQRTRKTDAKATAEKDIDRLESDLKAQQEAVPRVQEADRRLSALPGLREERDALQEAERAVSRRQDLQERILDLGRQQGRIENEISGLEDTIAAFDADQAKSTADRVEKLQAQLDDLQQQREKIRNRKLAAVETAKKEQTLYLSKAQDLEELGRETGCPTCTRPLGEHFEPVLAHLMDQARAAEQYAEDAQIDADMLTEPEDAEIEIEVRLDEAKERFDVLNTQRQNAETARVTLTARQEQLREVISQIETHAMSLEGLAAQDYDADRLAEVRAEVQSLEALSQDSSLAQDRGRVSRIPETEEGLGEAKATLERLTSELETLDRDIAGIGFDHTAHNVLKGEVDLKRTGLEDAKIAAGRAEEAVKAAERRLAQARTTLASYDERASRSDDVRADHLNHERVAARLAEFRVAIAATIRPEMEELMSGFVHLLTDGRHEAVELSEDFSATLYESGQPVEVVSGGTEDIAALAMRLALSQMIAERAGHPLSLLVLDEPFGSLDETRRANVLTLIRRLRTVFRQVIVISHVAETRDAVDHAIEMVYDEENGLTRVAA